MLNIRRVRIAGKLVVAGRGSYSLRTTSITVIVRFALDEVLEGHWSGRCEMFASRIASAGESCCSMVVSRSCCNGGWKEMTPLDSEER